MKLLGKTRIGGTPFELVGNTKRVARYAVPFATSVPKLTIYVDGLGSGNGDQVVRGVIYDSGGSLLAMGDEVLVADGQAAGWVDLPFTTYPGGVQLPAAGNYDFGVLGGVQTNSVRVYGDDPGSAAFTGSLPLTVSGNEITDVMRAAALSWPTTQLGGGSTDGATIPGGVAIWEAGTNLTRNAQCDGITDWYHGGPGVTSAAIDATTPAQFSPQSIKLTGDGTGAGQGGGARTAIGQAIAVGTPCAGSIRVKAPVGLALTIRVTIVNTDASQTNGANVAYTGTGNWDYVAPGAATVAASKTGDQLQLQVFTSGAVAFTGVWLAHSMLQKGTTLVSPYIPTSGGSTATRAAGRVQAPASLLTATQGWFAIRVRWGSLPSLFPVFWGWGPDNNNGFELIQNSGTWSFRRLLATAGAHAEIVSSPATGDLITVVCAWTATTISISLNGSVFTTVANSSIPTIAQTMFDIGSRRGTQLWADSSYYWAACGIGVPSNADAAALFASGNAAPAFSALPALPTMLWSGVTLTYTVAQSGQANVDTYSDGASNPFGTSTPLDEDMSVFATYTTSFTVPDGEPEDQIAQLPWELSQEVFGSSGVDSSTVRPGTLGFYGTNFDGERGALMLAARDGAFADLVGKRVAITSDTGTAYVYCKGVAALNDGEDVAVTQRVYAALNLLADVPIQVEIAEVS